MNIPFSSPQLARINVKIGRVEKEIDKANQRVLAAGDVAALRDDIVCGIQASAVHNIYNGIEQILEDVAVVVDGGKPTGDSTHSALLDQMSIETKDRPAVIAADLMASFDDLRRFRHLYRHSYGIDLRPTEVAEKFAAITQQVWPAVLSGLEALRHHLDDEVEPDAPGASDLGRSSFDL